MDGVASVTPVLTSRTLDDEVRATVAMKAECFQRTGSFKFRGAYNAVAALDPEVRSAGVIGYSSGNHAQALALAAALHDVPAVLVMPSDAPSTKLAATRGYGAEVITYDRYGEDREAIGAAVAAERGLTLIPPFDHPDVIAGQGTAALELFEATGPLDVVVVCVGGGGMIAGWSTVADAQAAPPAVFGVEPETGNDVQRSLLEGRRVTIDTPRTIADGLQTTSCSDRTFAVIQERVDGIVTVSDEELVDTMRFAFERMKVVLEPSGATALAAVRFGKVDVVGRRVGLVLSGGNVAVDRFTELLAG